MGERRLWDSGDVDSADGYLAGEECDNVAVTVRCGAERGLCGEAGRDAQALAFPRRHGPRDDDLRRRRQ